MTIHPENCTIISIILLLASIIIEYNNALWNYILLHCWHLLSRTYPDNDYDDNVDALLLSIWINNQQSYSDFLAILPWCSCVIRGASRSWANEERQILLISKHSEAFSFQSGAFTLFLCSHCVGDTIAISVYDFDVGVSCTWHIRCNRLSTEMSNKRLRRRKMYVLRLLEFLLHHARANPRTWLIAQELTQPLSVIDFICPWYLLYNHCIFIVNYF